MLKKLTISKKLGFIVVLVSFIALIGGFLILNLYSNKIENNVHSKFIVALQKDVKDKLQVKKDVGISNAISVANDNKIKQALIKNNRELAIEALKNLGKNLKESTPFKNVKIHVHTKDNKSFVRIWKLKKFGDDLSSFRFSIVKVNDTKKTVNTFELGKAGLSLRSVVPITSNTGEHLGSLEFIQGLNSVAKAFNKKDDAFILLMDKRVSSVKTFKEESLYKENYIISQKFIDKDFLKNSKTININKLLKNKSLKTNKYLYTYIDIKDFRDKKLGIAIVASPLDKVNSAVNSAREIIDIALLITIVLVIFIIISIIISIRKVVITPLKTFNTAIEELISQDSDNSSMLIKKQSDDELGDVADNFNRYLQMIDKNIQEDLELIKEAEIVTSRVQHGWYSQYIEKSTSNQALNDFKDSVNNMIKATKENFENMNIVLEKFSQYDYRDELKLENIEKGGVFEILVKDINALKNAITEMLLENKQNGFTLKNSSNSLLENVQTLSNASNHAAASLEETAAALEEVTGNISNNNNSIVQMSQFAQKIMVSANEGEKLSNETTNSMDEINEQVEAINEAISIIDQISFQTNILSLNAAVEAATAGEAGKGFAVVAQEVRNLASRSSEAANEIKTLVENAKTKANNGKCIADKMKAGYHGLNENISNTIQLITNIQSASKEQSSGISQINDAITKLDQQTQQNANIANTTKDIAINTQEIALRIVDNTNEKEFIGK